MKAHHLIFLFLASVGLSACGNDDKSPFIPDLLDEPSTSFWEDAEYSLQLTSILRFSGDMENVKNRLESYGVSDDGVSNIQTMHYDEHNRLAMIETLVYPRSDTSVLPPEGGRAMLIEYFFSSDPGESDFSTMSLWDNWWDGASGRLSETVTWTAMETENAMPLYSLEERIHYDTSQEGELIVKTENYSSTSIMDDNGLLIERSISYANDSGEEYEGLEVWLRDNNGRLLEVVRDMQEVLSSYSYGKNGELRRVEHFVDSELNEAFSYEYIQVDGQYVVLVEKYVNLHTGNHYIETEVKIYSETQCHATLVDQVRRERPEYLNCEDPAAWH